MLAAYHHISHKNGIAIHGMADIFCVRGAIAAMTHDLPQ